VLIGFRHPHITARPVPAINSQLRRSSPDSAGWTLRSGQGDGRGPRGCGAAVLSQDGRVVDDRTEPALIGDERAILISVLDRQRDTLAWKCSGLGLAQLEERAVSPSALSLMGLVEHLAAVERSWFQRVLQGADAPAIWESDYRGEPSSGSGPMDGAIERWRLECDRSRAFVSGEASLDMEVEHCGETFSLRYVLIHMIEEYARHNGHADLLRERLDGSTGE